MVGADGQFRADGAADLTRGGGPYAGLRIGLASGLPAMPDEGRREGSLVKSAAALATAWASATPSYSPSRQPTGTGPAGAERQRERRPGRRVGGASGPAGAALKSYRKFSHGRWRDRMAGRQMGNGRTLWPEARRNHLGLAPGIPMFRRWLPKLVMRLSRTALPFIADASDGLPIMPVFVKASIPRVTKPVRSSAK